MPIRDLAEVGARLEETVRSFPGDSHSTEAPDLYDRYEMVAIAMLDCEYMEFAPDVLETYLANFLAEKRTELGLPPFNGATP